MENTKNKVPVTHFQWEENGVKYSAHKIGGALVSDSIMKEIEGEMKKQFSVRPVIMPLK